MYDPKKLDYIHGQLEIRDVSVEEPSGRVKYISLVSRVLIPPNQGNPTDELSAQESYIGYVITRSEDGLILAQRWGKHLGFGLRCERDVFGMQREATLDGVVNDLIHEVEQATISELQTSVPIEVAEYLHQMW